MTVETTLLERAAAVRPVLERNAGTTDALRRLADENVQALRDAGLCRLMVPARFGGYQTSIRTYLDVMAEIGRGCGSTAWVASLINVCAWLAALFPEQAQADIWGADPDAWVAGSLAPNGSATPVEGGWRVSGRWPWASGSMHAQWAACGIHMKNERGETADFGLSLMPMGDLRVEDTWFMAGMKGTGSNTVVADGAFVPAHRFLPYPDAFAGRYRTEHTDEAIYRAALVPVTVLILAPSQLGVARAALEHVMSRSKARGITHTTFATQAESAGFQMLIAEAAMKIDTAALHVGRAADDLDRAAASSQAMDLAARAGPHRHRARGQILPRGSRTAGAGARHVEPGRFQPDAAAVARRAHGQPPRHHGVAGESRGVRESLAGRGAEHHASRVARSSTCFHCTTQVKRENRLVRQAPSL